MFHHVKELQFDVRVSKPDPRFAGLLLEQFGGSNGELKAAMQYFVQAFAARQPHPDKYFNMSSNRKDVRGPWNEGTSPELKEEWKYISDPAAYVKETKGLSKEQVNKEEFEKMDKKNQEMSQMRSQEIKAGATDQWSKYE